MTASYLSNGVGINTHSGLTHELVDDMMKREINDTLGWEMVYIWPSNGCDSDKY